jgi:hypothetical protein
MPKKGRKVRSMRGVEIDFDLMDIKAQIAAAPKPLEVKAREDFVDRRMRRRLNRIRRRQEAEMQLATRTDTVQDDKSHTDEGNENQKTPPALQSLPKEEALKIAEEMKAKKKPIVTKGIDVTEPKKQAQSAKPRQIKKKQIKED